MRPLTLIAVLLAVLLAGACRDPSFEPVVPDRLQSLEPEIRDLIEAKLALARAEPTSAHAHATLGLVYEANELWEESERSFANAIAIDDGHPVWLFHHALVLREAGRAEDSIALLREAAKRMESSAAVEQRLGHLLLQTGDVPNARAAFERALRAEPGRPECMADMAAVEVALERWSAALELAQRALAIDPSLQSASHAAGLALQGLGRDEEARSYLKAGLDAQPRWLWDPLTQEVLSYRLTTSGLLEKARNAFATGDYAQAAKLYERILKRSPEDPELLNNMAACLIEIGEGDRAVHLLGLALRRSPRSFAAHLNLAELHSKRGELDLAREHADMAVETGGGVGRARFVRARVMALQHDLEGAAKELEKAAELDAHNPQYALALAELAVERNRNEEARKWCRKALELEPTLVSARANLGVLALRAGDVAEARSMLAVLERQAPAHPRTIALREGLEKLGR